MTQTTDRPESARTILGQGWVALIDSYGDDLSIERAARQSYGKGTRKVSQTRGLLRRLMYDRHDTPFEAVDITAQFKVPIFVARQLIRHRLFSVNEVSGRYSILPEEYYVPDLDQICFQDKKNKQGRAEQLTPDMAAYFQDKIRLTSAYCFQKYNDMVEYGIARETARMVLPLNTFTIFTFKGNLRTWLHFLHLRMDKHAQWETRQAANAVAEIVRGIAPEAFDAWEEYVYGGTWLSRTLKGLVLKHVNRQALYDDDAFAQLGKAEVEKTHEWLDGEAA